MTMLASTLHKASKMVGSLNHQISGKRKHSGSKLINKAMDVTSREMLTVTLIVKSLMYHGVTSISLFGRSTKLV